MKLSHDDAIDVIETMQHFDHVLGVLAQDEVVLDEEIEELLAQREEARKAKNWAEADEIRHRIESAGYVLEDTPKGARVKKKR